MYCKRKKAFTLAEVLVSLAVVGVLTALTIPLLRPTTNNNNVLFKSAYNLVEITVGELVNDEALYSNGIFDNTFCTNFAAKINTVGTVNCAASTEFGSPNFITANGMRWYGLNSLSGGFFTIKVDIDGASKGSNTAGSDILQINVSDTGKISVPNGGLEVQYLTAS